MAGTDEDTAMKIRAVIFDLDGVIVFTDKYHYQAWKKMADGMQIYFDEEINNRLRGISRRESLEIILEQYQEAPLSEKEKDELVRDKNETYKRLLDQMKPEDVATEVRDTLAELRARGYKLAIGSSSKNAGRILKKTGLTQAFDAVSDGTNITRSKPDPEVFLKACEYLGEEPSHCLVVEDAAAGISAGIAAGMKTAELGDAAKSNMADYHLKSLKELLDIL